MKRITRLRRSVKAVSPIISVLLMIAIAVSAALVAYAWVSGYMDFTTTKVSKSIQIQSVSENAIYVQNVGDSDVKLSDLYIDQELEAWADIIVDGTSGETTLTPGQTATIGLVSTLPRTSNQVKIKVITMDGISAEATKTFSSASSGSPSVKYTITATAGSHGSITPSGSVTVTEGGDRAFTITADTNYHVADVVVDSVSVGAVSSYSFTNVVADHAISATFEEDAAPIYVIVASAGFGGSISPSGSVDVAEGDDQTFTITAGSGYHVVDVVVDLISQGVITSYTFDDVNANHEISATFEEDATVTYTIAASYAAGGTISPSGDVIVNEGDDQSFSIVPSVGYHIFDVVVDTISQGPITSYTFDDVAADHAISVSFAIDTFTISASAGNGGTIDPSGSVSVDYGADQLFTVAATTGYHIFDVVVDSVSQGPIAYFTFDDVAADHVISAAFEEDVQPEEVFTLIALPDTQYYSASYPQIFVNQTQWIVNNVDAQNIVFVTHEGDIVNTYYSSTQWNHADAAMSVLDGHVAYGVLPGNHDLSSLGSAVYYNQHFGYSRYSSESWYGGAYNNENTNNYELFSAGGDDFLILHIQYNPTNDTIDWAKAVVEANPARRVIVTTHDYLTSSAGRSSTGERIWERLVEPCADQVFLVLCGHIHDEAMRTDVVNGHEVHQLLADYQGEANGGNGYLRILEFDPNQNTISVNTYSPYLDQYQTDADSQFVLDY